MDEFTAEIKFFSKHMDNQYFPAFVDVFEQFLPGEKVTLSFITLLLEILDTADQEDNETLVLSIVALFNTYIMEGDACVEAIFPSVEAIFPKVLQFITNEERDADFEVFIEAYNCIYHIYRLFPEYLNQYFSTNFHIVEMMLSHLPNNLPVKRNQKRNAERSPLLSVLSCLADSEEVFQKIMKNNLLDLQIFGQVITSCPIGDQEIIREVYYVLSQIVYASAEFGTALVADRGFMAQLLEDMQHENWEIRLETAWIISNSSYGCTTELLRIMFEGNIIETFCRLFNQLAVTQHKNTNQVGIFLRAFGHWLKLGEELVDNDLVLYNSVALKLAECGVVEPLQVLTKDELLGEYEREAEILLTEYFGERYDEYLARLRGLKTKRALQCPYTS